MQRLRDVLDSLKTNRFLILYGNGVDDSYFTPALKEIDLQQALVHQLRQIGYQRIIFVAPDRPFFFLDDESEKQCEPYFWNGRMENYRPDQAITMQPGPLGQRLLIQTTNRPVSIAGTAMGDNHSIRLLDTVFRDSSGLKTAFVFTSAENYLTHFEDPRTLSSVIEGWTRVPTSNLNRCIFLFSANQYSELVDIAGQLKIPELRTIILRENRRNKKGTVRLISGPGRDEAIRMIQLSSRLNLTEVVEEQLPTLSDWIASEHEQGKTWMSRFLGVQSIDIETARIAGWFPSHRGDSRPASDRLGDLIGLSKIKERIQELTAWMTMRSRLANKINNPSPPLLHMVFSGNPGTGKTTVARLTGEILQENGILTRGHLVEAKASDLVADHVGGTSIKTNQIIDEALDGVLFVDEAYALSANDRGGFGAEAIETLLTRMEDDRERLVVILAGYPAQIDHLIRSNPGLSRRFPAENRFIFPDYSGEELKEIFNRMVDERKLSINANVVGTIDAIIDEFVEERSETFGNAGEIRNLIDSLERKCYTRIIQSGIDDPLEITYEDISSEYATYLPKEEPDLDSILAELDQLVGLDSVKNMVRKLAARAQFERFVENAQGKSQTGRQIQHLIFTGNPGTGKTTVARLLGRIYASLGFLRKGHVVEASMPDLIAGYVGQTTGKVMEKVHQAEDGVLFIDEAYSLVRNKVQGQASYGQEAVDTLVKAIEDKAGRMLVIMAGYPSEMEILLRSNPGLRSRFANPIYFEDFDRENQQILLETLLSRDGYVMDPDIQEEFLNKVDQIRLADPDSFGNAREVIQSYESAKDRLAVRVVDEMQSRLNGRSKLMDAWNHFQMGDVNSQDVTVVVAADSKPAAVDRGRLRSWVLPKL
jgi:SpoVK/Ycf46/Vps4 family AAA+-type ATPase